MEARLSEGRAGRATGSADCARLAAEEAEQAAQAVARRLAAAQRLAAVGEVAAPALERARRRDPDPAVQRAVAAALGQAEGARAAAAPLR